LPVSVFGVPNTGIPVSVYTGLETLAPAEYDIHCFGIVVWPGTKKLIGEKSYANIVMGDDM
jgi:hypothetical protein